MAATMTMTVDGRFETATSDALSLLGVTLDELRGLPPGSFSPDPPDKVADAAFRDQWEAEGRPDIGGQATVQRLDGSRVRVRFAITETADDRLLVILEPIDAPVEAPSTMYTAGDVLSAWRAAERRLSALPQDSPEWSMVTSEIEGFRSRYQQIFRRGTGLGT